MNKIFKKIIFLFLILFSLNLNAYSNEKIKIGLLIPMTGENKNLGQIVIQATRMALKDIGSDALEIYPKDTQSSPAQTLKAANDFQKLGINIVIGPIFFNSLKYLDELENITFLSLTNKTIDLPKNIISSGVNATSQLNAIKKFLESKKINKTIFLTPNLDYKDEIKKAIKQSRIKIYKHHVYDTDPTKLTKQIEEITKYKIRKQNLEDEIKRIENSDLSDSEKKFRVEKLNKRYTLGNLNFDSIIISDFDESLKSVITSLLYTDVLPKDKYFISFNQWFEKSFLKETTLQPMYYPSVNKDNLENFKKKFDNEFGNEPNHLALLSYDLVGLIYYLSINNDISEINNLFKKKNSFKGKIGIFDIQDNKIYHRMNFYEINEGRLKEIF
tara:strand:+ start:1486 stop:2643 length:1158 start_codon:yes stop_codon:yes gene_type:complete